MKRSEVWWVDFDPAQGSEVQKTRPAVIVSNDTSNRLLSRVVVVPFTSNTKKIYPGNVLVTIDNRQSKLMADQITTADKSRLKSYICSLSRADMTKVEAVIRLHLDL